MEIARSKSSRPFRVTVVFILAAVLTILALTDLVDAPAERYHQQAFTRALATFAVARGLNGVISVIQGTEVAVSPAGVGVTFAPGEILDPVNDLVERFSWLMLASTISLGVQQIFMAISSWWGVRIAVVIAAVLLGVLWINSNKRPGRRRFAVHFFMLALFLRFAIPAIMLLNNGIYEVFLSEDYQNSSIAVEQATSEIEAVEEQVQPTHAQEPGFFDGVKRWWDDTAGDLNLQQRLEALKESASQATEHLLRLAAVFAAETIILPLFFLWLLLRIGKGLVRPVASLGAN